MAERVCVGVRPCERVEVGEFDAADGVWEAVGDHEAERVCVGERPCELGVWVPVRDADRVGVTERDGVPERVGDLVCEADGVDERVEVRDGDCVCEVERDRVAERVGDSVCVGEGVEERDGR